MERTVLGFLHPLISSKIYTYTKLVSIRIDIMRNFILVTCAVLASVQSTAANNLVRHDMVLRHRQFSSNSTIIPSYSSVSISSSMEKGMGLYECMANKYGGHRLLVPLLLFPQALLPVLVRSNGAVNATLPIVYAVLEAMAVLLTVTKAVIVL